MADASMTPPPDRPETMTAKEQHLMDVYDSLGIKWGDDPFPVIGQLRATYAALEAVKAENAKLERDWNALRDSYDATVAQLAEAQKDSARFRWLAMQRWWDAGSWAPRGFTNLIDAVDAARSGRKEEDNAE